MVPEENLLKTGLLVAKIPTVQLAL